MRIVALTAVAMLSFVGCDKRPPTQGDRIMADVRRSIEIDKKWQVEYKNYKFPTVTAKHKSIQYSYSEFDKQSLFSTDFFPFGQDELYISFISDSKGPVNVKPPAEVILAFYKAEPYDFRFMVEGKEILPHKETTGLYKLHTRDLLKIVEADKVLVKVDSFEFPLRESEKKMFYHMVSLMGN
jgi:hypothetical protein